VTLQSQDQHAHRILSEIDAQPHVSQRSLASRLGIALGLTNLYLKRLVRKGYVKCVNTRPNRVRYLLTPTGLAEKTRLTYEFMEHSLRLYRETRHHLRAVLQAGVSEGCRTVAIYGVGEPAELAYMSLKELGLEPVAVFGPSGEAPFLGMPVRPIEDHRLVAYDLMVVASLQNPAALVSQLVDAGVVEAKVCTLRPLTRRLTVR
jgi:DNA-binding MarR family transcriptional regulator